MFLLNQREIQEELLKMHGGELANLGMVLNRLFSVEGYINIADMNAELPPEHIPKEIESVFAEGAKCVAIKCWNAAGCMFRLCIDMATRALLPSDDVDGLDNRTRRELGRRLAWIFKTKRLPEELGELSHCIREDGNDGAHAGTLSKEDVLDLQEFTFALLERHYTLPRRLELAKERRTERRKPKGE